MVLELLAEYSPTRATIAVGLVAIVLAIVVPRFIRFIRLFRYFQTFTGEPNYSIFFGNLHKLPTTGEGRIAYIRDSMDNHNPKYHRLWWGPVRVNLGVFHPETVKVILKSSAPKSRGFGQTYEHAIPWIGEGLIASNGAKWARSRRLLTPAFHFDILKQYVDVYNQAADTLFEKFDKFAETGESFDACPLITLCTLDVILKCAMSYDADIQRKGPNAYAQATRELLAAFNVRIRSPLLWPDFIFRFTSAGRQFYKNCDYVHKVAEDVIAKRRQQLDKDSRPKGRHLDFLDILLTARDEDGNPMTTLEIRNEVDTFLFAGHDTTAAATSWILYCFAKNPEYQVKVQAEIDAVLEGRDTDHILWSDISKFHLLPLCIKEAMRLYPPVPVIQRILNEPIEIDGKTIPPGTNITIGIMQLHINPLIWDKPDEYRPERFLPENMKDKDSFCFTPFSAGSRNCIGQNFALNEEKVLMSRILHRYNVELAPDAPPVERSAMAILTAENGLWFRLKRR